LRTKEKNERDDHFKKPPFKPPNVKPKVKGKGKENRATSTNKDEGERPYSLTTKRKFITTIIVGNYTWKRDQRSMEEKESNR